VKITTDKIKTPTELPWRATRSEKAAAYFAPTGVDAR
jgi:hypothetical protein